MAKPILGFMVSDLHVGSIYGLWPENYRFKGGGYILNPGQEHLLGAWKKMLRRLPPRLDFVLFNGDLIDGKQKKDEGRDLINTSTYHQRRACKRLVAPLLKKAKRVYVVRGTRYHEDEDEMEEFAESIGAECGDDEVYCKPVHRLRRGDIYIEARHKISGAWLYTLSALQREHRADKEAADFKGYSADLIIGAHRHQYLIGGGNGWLAVTLPCMELQTDWAAEKQANLWIPDLGGVLLHIYPGAKKQGLQPIFVQPYLYAHPQPEVLDI